MSLRPLSASCVHFSRVLSLLALSSLALLGCGEGEGGGASGGGASGGGAGGSGAGGGGAGGGQGGSSAGSAGDGGATSTETHGCPSNPAAHEGEPCYDVGLKCPIDQPAQCGQSGHSLDCYDWSDVWILSHWTTYCWCPEVIPANGDTCDPKWTLTDCHYKVAAECGEADVQALCGPDAAGVTTWTVADPVCPP